MNSIPDSDIKAEIHAFVLKQACLGVYDPVQPRRPRIPVSSFEIELLEIDEAVVHAAGPVVLQTEHGAVENFLRISLSMEINEGRPRVVPGAEIRAAYIVEVDLGSGACKETAALANC